jgi:hypothetical protein
MTVLSLERLHIRPDGRPLARRLRNRLTGWNALVARSVETSRAYAAAPTMSARRQVLAQFADTGA